MAIDIETLAKISKSINIFELDYPEEFREEFQIPEEIIRAWKNHTESLNRFKEILDKYKIPYL